MSDFPLMDRMSDKDIILFKKCIRRLLDVTFIVADKEEELYEFIASESVQYDVNAYLRWIGFKVIVDDRLRVAMLRLLDEDVEGGGFKRVNLLRFNKEQVQLLMVLWLLYLERMGYREPVFATVGDIVDKCSSYRIELKPADLKKAYKIFKRYSLIGYTDKEFSEETVIELYPSIQFCLDVGQMKTILSERLSVATLMIGYDNRFGHRREDGYEQYVAYGKELGISVIDSDSFSYGNGSVSSSMVRRFISTGDVERAAECLGRPYSLSGMVVHGEAKGRTIGFPTANIVPADADKLIPDGGVYAVLVSLDDSSTMLNGMMNIGSRPTFDGKMQTLEVHIFDFDGDIYKHSLRVFFSSPDELAKQLETDEKVCRLQLLSRS